MWCISGVAIWAVSAEVWMAEDATRSMNQLWDHVYQNSSFFLIGACLVWWGHQLLKRLDKMEREIGWLNKTLRAVKDQRPSNLEG